MYKIYIFSPIKCPIILLSLLLGQLSKLLGSIHNWYSVTLHPKLSQWLIRSTPFINYNAAFFNVQYPPPSDNIEIHCRIEEGCYLFKCPVQVIQLHSHPIYYMCLQRNITLYSLLPQVQVFLQFLNFPSINITPKLGLVFA